MSMKSQFQLKANVKLYEFPPWFTYQDYLGLRDHNPESLKKFLRDEGTNLVVDAGLSQIIDLMIATDTDSFTHCRVGSGTNTPAAGDTDMQTIIGSGLAVTNRYKVAPAAHFDTFFSTSDNNGTWEETGIANAATGSDLLCRRNFSSTFTKATTNTALIAWTITLAAVAD